jgi:Na+-translocating ferredoxin:NAD+ oxidoreductase RnfG subunit
LRSRLTALAIALAVVAASPAATATVFLSRTEAIETAFPGADRVAEQTHVLTEGQVRVIEQRARRRLESKIVTVYTGHKDGAVMGYALIDVHVVRTQPEAFLVVISPEGQVRDVRMLAFYEPREYLPPDRWFEQFRDERLTPELSTRRKIHSIAGATLSSRAVTGGVRRALALFEVLMVEGGVAAESPAEAGSLGR